MNAPSEKPETEKSREAPTILVVDDDQGQRSLLGGFLERQGLRVLYAGSGEQALSILDAEPVEMMITDVRMPGLSGFETLRQARVRHPRLPVLLVTAYADVHDAVDAMRDGAVNYLEKPIDLDELLASVREAVGMDAAAPPSEQQIPELPKGIIAKSQAMLEVIEEAARVAPSDSRLLITGESGAGKEVIVDLIHAWSGRRSGPLIMIN
jgi:DNA-binding NtrC family response regulator